MTFTYGQIPLGDHELKRDMIALVQKMCPFLPINLEEYVQERPSQAEKKDEESGKINNAALFWNQG